MHKCKRVRARLSRVACTNKNAGFKPLRYAFAMSRVIYATISSVIPLCMADGLNNKKARGCGKLKMTEITYQELWNMIESRQPVVLIDTMPWPTYRHSHIAGAVNLLHDRIADLARWIIPDRNAATVVYCQSSQCRHAEQVAEELEQLGYTRVIRYRGGKREWFDEGLPMEYHRPPSGCNIFRMG